MWDRRQLCGDRRTHLCGECQAHMRPLSFNGFWTPKVEAWLKRVMLH